MFQFGSKGSGDGQFNQPTGIGVNNDHQIIVSESYNHRVQVFDERGMFKFKFGGRGFNDGQFNHPSGVAIDDQHEDRIIVADSGNDRIQVFSSRGAFLFKFGSNGKGKGQFNYPIGVGVTRGMIVQFASLTSLRETNVVCRFPCSRVTYF